MDAPLSSRPYVIVLSPKDYPPERVSVIVDDVHQRMGRVGTMFNSGDVFALFRTRGGGFGGWGQYVGAGVGVDGLPTFDVVVVVENGAGLIGKGNYEPVNTALKTGRKVAVWREDGVHTVTGIEPVEQDPDVDRKTQWQDYARLITE